jgi:serine/threonine protein kinase/tetratricopeptide (TPR) repeat protein
MTLAPGTKLGPYEILESIGSGGMGEVWKARNARLGRIVAIKKVKEQHSERFKQEARSIAALNHPNICQIHDIGDDYLVLEYVEGKPLSSPLPEQETVRLAIQIASALEEAHQHGIIHRDLKPSNIMVTEKGSVKLLDFGLAKLYEQDAATSQSPTADVPATQAGAILGTVAYMSPEQAQGKPVDARSDIFSFGLMFYEMLSGKRAFSGDSNFAVMEAIVRQDPPLLQISTSLEKIVKRCLEKQPSARYQRMSALKTELEEVLGKMQSKTSEEPQPSIAVLPFVNMSGDKEQEYFSDGLAEEIINALIKIPGLKVTARTSAFAFRGKEQDIRKIAEILNVQAILEGSVRKSGNRIRVTAQLINASDGYHLWSQRYDRELLDVFALQDEISAAIVEALKVRLGAEAAIAPHRDTPKLPAYEAYLKARYHWGRLRPEPLRLCKEYLDQAISLDPNFALAHCSYADYLLGLTSAGYLPAHQAMPLMRDEARKALAIDPLLPEAYTALGVVTGTYNYDWREAEQCFLKAMAREPIPPSVRQWYGWFYLLPIGRLEESIEQQKQGLKEDPLNFIAHIILAYSYLIAGRFADAEMQARKALEFEENHAWGCMTLAVACAHQGRWTEALPIAERATPLIPEALGTIAGIMEHVREKGRAEEIVQKVLSGEPYGVPKALCHYYFLSGEIDKAAHWNEKMIEQRHLNAAHCARWMFRVSPHWFSLAKHMNLPDEAG